MATLGGGDWDWRQPSLGRRFYIRTWRGKLVLSKWPRKQTAAERAKSADQREWFKQANRLAQYADPAAQVFFRELTAGTVLMPRDLIISAMAGRLFPTIVVDGQRMYSMALRRDITAVLDVCSNVPGTVLFRGPDFWEALLPPVDPDEVITSQGGGLPPVWRPGGSAGGTGVAAGGLVDIRPDGEPTQAPVTWDIALNPNDVFRWNFGQDFEPLTLTIASAGGIVGGMVCGGRVNAGPRNDAIARSDSQWIAYNGILTPGASQISSNQVGVGYGAGGVVTVKQRSSGSMSFSVTMSQSRIPWKDITTELQT